MNTQTKTRRIAIGTATAAALGASIFAGIGAASAAPTESYFAAGTGVRVSTFGAVVANVGNFGVLTRTTSTPAGGLNFNAAAVTVPLGGGSSFSAGAITQNWVVTTPAINKVTSRVASTRLNLAGVGSVSAGAFTITQQSNCNTATNTVTTTTSVILPTIFVNGVPVVSAGAVPANTTINFGVGTIRFNEQANFAGGRETIALHINVAGQDIRLGRVRTQTTNCD